MAALGNSCTSPLLSPILQFFRPTARKGHENLVMEVVTLDFGNEAFAMNLFTIHCVCLYFIPVFLLNQFDHPTRNSRSKRPGIASDLDQNPRVTDRPWWVSGRESHEFLHSCNGSLATEKDEIQSMDGDKRVIKETKEGDCTAYIA